MEKYLITLPMATLTEAELHLSALTAQQDQRNEKPNKFRETKVPTLLHMIKQHPRN